MLFRNFFIILLLTFGFKAFCQPQDVEFHLNSHLLTGKKVLKVKCDFYDPYVWVLAQNNEVYRVNSQTLVVDDYTGQFSAYSGLTFIDIAGRSKDTVFIATNSTNVIHYKKGTIKLISTSDGITDTVNSIGIAGGGLPQLLKGASQLMIATKKGFCIYDSNLDKIISNDGNKSKIYEATYRTELYKDTSANTSNFITGDTVQFQPVRFFPDDGAEYNGYLWENQNEFGTHINTATTVYEATYDANGVFSNLFWGTDRGLFQNNFDNDYNVFGPTLNYMPGIKINKLTNIYGLTAFGSGAPNDISPFIKQNLLIGTDVGFYFTSSVYVSASGFDIIRNFSVFHDDELGNIAINDICVIPSSTTVPICENGVWLGADDGLYVLKPDYGAFLGAKQQLNAVSFKNQPTSLSDLKLCASDTAKAVVNTGTYTGNSFQWYKDGNELPGESKDSLSITAAGNYYAVLYDPCEGLHLESNHLTVEVISSPVFTFNYPDKMQECNSNPDTLQTTYNPGYHYQWYTNGALNGDTTNAYIVTQTGKYKVEVSACTNSWVPSKEVEVDQITLPVPLVTADKPVYCAEDIATLSVNTPVDASYTINWYQDGNLLAAKKDSTSIKVATGGNYTATVNSNMANCTQTSTPLPVAFTPAPVFTFNYPDQLQYCTGTPLTLTATGSSSYQYRWYKNDTLNNVSTASLSVTRSGNYKVEVSSCAGSWVASKEVQVTFITVAVPVITTDKQAYCNGDMATLSLAATYDPDFNIQWYNNNVLIPNSTGQSSITTSLSGNYTVSLVNGTANSDGTTCIQTSAVQPIVFNPPPTVSIKETINTTLCDGQTVSLNANYNNGTLQWSTGETGDHITVTQPGTYTANVTSPAGCQSEASMDVMFLPDPVFSLRDTSICTFKKQVITLTAPPGFAAYSWNNGESIGQIFQVTQPQTVSLTVTDTNGCQATQQIKVADQCPTVFIPNTFTPNGDGINDTWAIEGLDETATVKVFTRWGSEVYQSVGYSSPWNGEYGGKKLASGVYYYIVTAKSGSQKFSGSLTIIY